MAGATVTGYRVLDTLKHGGRRLLAGDRLTHDDIRHESAEILVEMGVLVADEWVDAEAQAAEQAAAEKAAAEKAAAEKAAAEQAAAEKAAAEKAAAEKAAAKAAEKAKKSAAAAEKTSDPDTQD